MDHTAKNRTAKVTDALTRKLLRSDPLSKGYFEDFQPDCEELWLTTVRIKSGSLPIQSSTFISETEDAAQRILSAHPVGSIFQPAPNEDDPFQTGGR